MDADRGGPFAKRCLPLLMANQAGWELLNPIAFTATWDGGEHVGAVSIFPHSPATTSNATSYFGLGILTWPLPFVFRTPPRYNLLLRGPANSPKDGIAPLEGLVETDWTSVTFTMNWKFTRPGAVTFQREEPFAMLVPVRRGELERFEPVVRHWGEEPEVTARTERWWASRMTFLRELMVPGSSAQRKGWQRDYMRGRNTDGGDAPEHQTKLRLAPFD